MVPVTLAQVDRDGGPCPCPVRSAAVALTVARVFAHRDRQGIPRIVPPPVRKALACRPAAPAERGCRSACRSPPAAQPTGSVRPYAGRSGYRRLLPGPIKGGRVGAGGRGVRGVGVRMRERRRIQGVRGESEGGVERGGVSGNDGRSGGTRGRFGEVAGAVGVSGAGLVGRAGSARGVPSPGPARDGARPLGGIVHRVRAARTASRPGGGPFRIRDGPPPDDHRAMILPLRWPNHA